MNWNVIIDGQFQTAKFEFRTTIRGVARVGQTCHKEMIMDGAHEALVDYDEVVTDSVSSIAIRWAPIASSSVERKDVTGPTNVDDSTSHSSGDAPSDSDGAFTRSAPPVER